jgi:hypothetical protein
MMDCGVAIPNPTNHHPLIPVRVSLRRQLQNLLDSDFADETIDVRGIDFSGQ